MLYIPAVMYMCVWLCAYACGKWSAWVCSFRKFTPGCYRPSAEQNDRNCFLLAQIQQSQLEDQSNGALRRPLIGHRTAVNCTKIRVMKFMQKLNSPAFVLLPAYPDVTAAKWGFKSWVGPGSCTALASWQGALPFCRMGHIRLFIGKEYRLMAHWKVHSPQLPRFCRPVRKHCWNQLLWMENPPHLWGMFDLLHCPQPALPGPSQGNGQGSPNGSINGSLECRSVLTFLLNC